MINNMGVRAYFAGRWTEAAGSYERSLELRRQAGDVAGEGILANNLAELLSYQGHHERAIELLNTASKQMRAAGYRVGAAYADVNLAMARARSGEVLGIEDALGRARTEFEQIGAGTLTLELDLRLVEFQLIDGRVESAVSLASDLWGKLEEDHHGNEELSVQLGPLLALALVATGDRDRARQSVTQAIDLAAGTANHYCEALAWHAQALLDGAAGDVDREAAARADELLSGLDVMGEPVVVSRTRRAISGPATVR